MHDGMTVPRTQLIHQALIGGHLPERERELLAQPSVASRLPIRFAKGSVLDEIEAHCAHCDRPIEQDFLRGNISLFTPQVVLLDAVGGCRQCQQTSRFNYRIHDDLSRTGLLNGQWVHTPVKLRWQMRFKRWLRGFIQGVPGTR